MTDEQEVQRGIGEVREQIEQGHTDVTRLEERIVELQHQRDTVRVTPEGHGQRDTRGTQS